MKIAFIGASGHFRYALKEAAKNEVAGVAPGVKGEDLSRLLSALEKHGVRAKVFSDWRDLAPLAEVFVVNTRFDQNAPVTEALLKENKFVFSEKPLATTLEGLESLRRANDASRGFVAGMFGIRYSSWFLTLKKHLPEIGAVRMISARKSYKLGVRPDFYKKRATFGGMICWVGIHGIDWILQLLGDDSIRTVSAFQSREQNHGNGEMETEAVAIFRSEKGVLASLTADYRRPDGAPTHGDDRVRAVGVKGILESAGGTVVLIDQNGERILEPEPEEDVFALFLGRVRGEEAGVTPEESFLATEIALKAQAAADREEKS